MSNNIQNETQRRLKRATQNVGIFSGLTAGMATTAVIMSFMTGMSYGTILSAGLAGTFIGLALGSVRRVQKLRERLGLE